MSSGEGTGVQMGSGDPWSNDDGDKEKTAAGQPETTAELEADIEGVRRQMSDVAGELHRRGDRVAEISRRWGKRIAPIAGGLVILAAAGFAYRYWRSRQRGVGTERWLRSLRSLRPRETFDELRTRASKAIAPREASRPHRLRDVGLKVGTAALGAAASVAGKQLARKLMGANSRPRP